MCSFWKINAKNAWICEKKVLSLQSESDFMEKNVLLHQEIIMAGTDNATTKRISALKKEGQIVKIAPKIYTTNLNDTAENIIRRNLFFILGHLYPNAVLSFRSAFELMPTPDGHIYLTYSYTKKITFPGITVHLIEGPDALQADYPFMNSLRIACPPRAYLENLQQGYTRDGVSKTLSQKELEERLEKMLQANGETELNKLRDAAREVAPTLGMLDAFKKFDAIIGALLSTKPSRILSSPIAMARAFGEPFDSQRIHLFHVLMAALQNSTFTNLLEPNQSQLSYENFAFFESYFSNYIEGTEFELEDAKQIVQTRTPMPSRNADSHDILGTYYIVSNRKEMSIIPTTADELIEILQKRHRIMMSQRLQANPGMFKVQNNRAGETHFVDYNLVRGTLRKGFEIYSALQHPFARAIFMLFMISEVHPFTDGNGRISRIMMNAELTAAGQSKIIIPTVFRTDYLGTLRQLTRREQPENLIRAIDRVRHFSYQVQGDDFNAMQAYLERCNAFKEEDAILQF